jgi:hypothetical protein
MVEIRNLRDGEPNESAWVLVQKKAGLYFISAKAKGSPIDDSPAAFKTPDAAIHTATKWADLLAAPVLYIKEARASSRPKLENERGANPAAAREYRRE